MERFINDGEIRDLSTYINNKATYYKMMQEVRDKPNWEYWIIFMLEGVEQTSNQTIMLIEGV